MGRITRQGTPAAKLDFVLSEEEIKKNFDKLLEVQNEISKKKNDAYLGKTFEVLVEGYDEENLMYFGRTYADSIEVDTTTYFAAEDEVAIGSFVSVKILDADSYDCTGVQV